MPNTFDDPEMRARLIDLLDHRLTEANQLVSLVWNTDLQDAAKQYLDGISVLLDAARGVLPRSETPTVTGMLNANVISTGHRRRHPNTRG